MFLKKQAVQTSLSLGGEKSDRSVPRNRIFVYVWVRGDGEGAILQKLENWKVWVRKRVTTVGGTITCIRS